MARKCTAERCGFTVNLISPVSICFIIALSILTNGATNSCGQGSFQQTREQCDECCKKSTNDAYYQEQCRLKCFRNHDSCVGSSSSHAESAPSPKTEARDERKKTPESPRPTVEQQAPLPKPQVANRPQFVWPNPLNLAPGREGEAAAHILAINGITPQHPNYSQALSAIQGVLMNFVRNNPSGGSLPTAQLQQIISQLR